MAEEMPAGEAARRADLVATDLESLTEAEMRRLLGSGPVCRFGYAVGNAVVAAATGPGAGWSRGVIKLHGRLVPMEVRYQTLQGEGFELSGDDAQSGGSVPRRNRWRRNAREAEARLHIGKELKVDYAGFYECTS